MLAYDWMLALVAFAVAAPLVLVLRAVQRHLVAGLRRGPRAQRRDARRRSPRWSPAPRRCAPTTPARRYGERAERRHRAAHRRADPGRHDRRVPVPARARCSRVLTVAAVVVVGVARGPGERADRRGAGRLRVPDLPVPRADRRVHRGARPDPDRGGRAAPGARRARHPGRPAAARVAACRCRRAARRSTSRDVTFAYPTRGVTRRGRRRRAARRRRAHPGRPAGGRGRRHRLGQDHARAARSPASPTRRRRRSASAACRCTTSPTTSCAGASSWCRRSRSCSTTRSPPTSASPGPARRCADDRGGRRPTRRSATGSTTLPDGLDDARSASAASSCRPASASSSRCCAPASPIPTCSCSTRRRRRSTRSPRCASRGRSTRLAEGRTTIAIAHRLSTAARADRVLVLDEGGWSRTAPTTSW